MATTYGVTDDGFVRMRLPEIRSEIVAALQDNLQAAGVTTAIETGTDSLFGIMFDTFAERFTSLWEQTEAVYAAMYPSTATGAMLDLASSFTGVTRLAAASSKGYVVLYGTEGTTVASGALLANSSTGAAWEITAETEITADAAADVSIALAGTAAAGTYTATISGATYSYTADSSATAETILQGLADTISAANLTAARTGTTLRLYGDGSRAYSFAVNSLLAITSIGSPVLAQTVETSTAGADAGTLTTITTATDGWTAVNNLADATAGRTTETDSELRARYSTGMYALGSATTASVVAKLKADVLGVETAMAFENTTDETDSVGRPAHSLHVVVDGGLDEEVAAVIADNKPAGIATFGSVSRAITDSTTGLVTTINFSRPTPVYLWIKAVVTVLEDGQTFPDDGLSQIRAALLAKGQALGIGDDVRWQSFLGPCYGIDGVGEVALTFATSTDPSTAPGAYASANVTIADYEQATFAIARIGVTSGS